MAISTFAELKTAIARWLWRYDSDIDAVATDLVMLCEDMLNNGTEATAPLRVKEMETSASISLVSGVGTLPTDYLGYREVKDGSGRTIAPAPPSYAGQETLYSSGGRAQYFAIKGGDIVTYPGDAGPITLEYWQGIPALSDAAPSNWLLAKSPRVYLFGSLMMGEAFMKEDDRLPMFANAFREGVEALTKSDNLGKYARAAVRPSVIGF